ncbi:hypothetical protein Taro_042746 [Colocasia esculenta]|uniref:Transcription factor GTE4 n=1 Tax=Colocasia esculenta TaxID=4460 RepID=A0A843X056_COLES|nr:hypothetical protein [Colocasia esculenta]
MASGPLVGGGGGDGSREKHRWGENKVYTRKFHRSSGKSSNSAAAQNRQQQQQPQPPVSSLHTVATTTEDVNSSLQQPAPPSHQHHEQQLSSFESAASGDDASSLNDNVRRQNPVSTSNRDNAPPANHTNHQHANHNNGSRPANTQKLGNGGHGRVLISLQSKSRHEIHELRRKLNEELDQVRALVKKLEARELQLAPSAVPAPAVTGYSHSQLSANNAYHSGGVKRPAANSEAASTAPLRRQLSVSVATGQVDNNSMSEAVEKEKRTPKVNQYYRNSEFLLGKDKFPPADSHKKSKANGSKKHHMSGEMEYGASVLDRKYAHAFKSCAALLSKLMKHKFGWVFNSPVDVKGLGLHDYYNIIKHPMDLGTVKTRMSKNWYKSPREFADDVRMTFQNAMTYNPKGQDVHIMAEQLSMIFEERWPEIEAEYAAVNYPMPMKIPPPLDMRVLERSESTTRPVLPDISTTPVSHKPHVARAPALKKPKAKDPNKRDMTYEEKQRLSNNLQSLPSEKLDCIVQIIKKRNTSLSQHDDEIEVDIDSVDTETLWELDRFVTNYKKSLSKNKRKAELASLARAGATQNIQERNFPNSTPAIMEPKERRTDTWFPRCQLRLISKQKTDPVPQVALQVIQDHPLVILIVKVPLHMDRMLDILLGREWTTS